MHQTRRKRIHLFTLVVPLVCVGGYAWFTYTLIQREKLRRPLLEAIRQADNASVRDILRKGADPNARDRPDGPVGLREMFTRLWSRNASAREENYYTALMLAAVADDNDSAKALLDRRAKVNAKGPAGTTALMEAARHDSLACIRLLLERGANIDAKDDQGETATVLAIKDHANDHMAAYLLIRSRANVKEADKSGHTAIFYAAQQDWTDLYDLLLAHGADVNTKDDSGVTLLMQAVEAEKVDVVKQLLARGADPNLKYGAASALSIALGEAIPDEEDRYDHRRDRIGRKLVQFLLDGGADADTTGEAGWPLLLRAIDAGDERVARLLIEHGANVNAQKNGHTALIAAATVRSPQIVAMLLKRSAHPGANAPRESSLVDRRPARSIQLDARNDEGMTPLMIAAANGDGEIVRLLLAAHADIRARDRDDMTALRYAADSPEVAALLRQAGATP